MTPSPPRHLPAADQARHYFILVIMEWPWPDAPGGRHGHQEGHSGHDRNLLILLMLGVMLLIQGLAAGRPCRR